MLAITDALHSPASFGPVSPERVHPNQRTPPVPTSQGPFRPLATQEQRASGGSPQNRARMLLPSEVLRGQGTRKALECPKPRGFSHRKSRNMARFRVFWWAELELLHHQLGTSAWEHVTLCESMFVVASAVSTQHYIQNKFQTVFLLQED